MIFGEVFPIIGSLTSNKHVPVLQYLLFRELLILWERGYSYQELLGVITVALDALAVSQVSPLIIQHQDRCLVEEFRCCLGCPYPVSQCLVQVLVSQWFSFHSWGWWGGQQVTSQGHPCGGSLLSSRLLVGASPSCCRAFGEWMQRWKIILSPSNEMKTK